MPVINEKELPFVGSSFEFVGAEHGPVAMSMFIVVAQPGRGPRLHRHKYDEIVYVIDGRSRWTVAGVEREAGAGDVLVVQAGEAHKFVAIGNTPLRQVDIHMNPRFEQENLE